MTDDEFDKIKDISLTTNALTILELMADSSPLLATEMTQKSGLTITEVENALDELEAVGFITQDGD